MPGLYSTHTTSSGCLPPWLSAAHHGHQPAICAVSLGLSTCAAMCTPVSSHIALPPRPVPRRESCLLPEGGVNRVRRGVIEPLFSPRPHLSRLWYLSSPRPGVLLGDGTTTRRPGLVHSCCHAHLPNPRMFSSSAHGIIIVILCLFVTPALQKSHPGPNCGGELCGLIHL